MSDSRRASHGSYFLLPSPPGVLLIIGMFELAGNLYLLLMKHITV